MAQSQRTAIDEQEYIKELRREEPIKTEVIQELRQQNKQLWQSQVMLLEGLIRAEDALRVYRLTVLERARHAVQGEDSHCIPHCTRHHWDSCDGWHRNVLAREDRDE